MSNLKNLSDPIALRVPADILSQIERIAGITERSRSWVIVRAMKAYLATEGRDILDAAEGKAEIARGGAADLDEVLDELDRRKDGDVAA
ncbi:MAG: ribbon-helix-helix domain-containing protein [Hyphomicrobiales bacterium]|nr:ribbon-helix-helix domain-containing protein [Hyphomicrobiales bacterium]